jgi:hypothetical protein
MISALVLLEHGISVNLCNSYEFLHSVLWLLVTANIVPSSPILVTLMMEALHSSEMLVLTTATQHSIPEDGILHSHHHENLKCYIAYTYSENPLCSFPFSMY